jgi:hypothetical protein
MAGFPKAEAIALALACRRHRQTLRVGVACDSRAYAFAVGDSLPSGDSVQNPKSKIPTPIN